ncbi:MAG: hypothetical protein M5U28_11670 [Sandaracinaceae bacterium]|nr:hypothetical protein [Sandaracinaceae bacterium]
MARVDGERLLVGGDRLVVAPQRAQRVAAAAVPARVVGVHLQRRLEGLEGELRVAAREARSAELQVGLEVAGAQARRLVERLHRVERAAEREVGAPGAEPRVDELLVRGERLLEGLGSLPVLARLGQHAPLHGEQRRVLGVGAQAPSHRGLDLARPAHRLVRSHQLREELGVVLDVPRRALERARRLVEVAVVELERAEPSRRVVEGRVDPQRLLEGALGPLLLAELEQHDPEVAPHLGVLGRHLGGALELLEAVPEPAGALVGGRELAPRLEVLGVELEHLAEGGHGEVVLALLHVGDARPVARVDGVGVVLEHALEGARGVVGPLEVEVHAPERDAGLGSLPARRTACRSARMASSRSPFLR